MKGLLALAAALVATPVAPAADPAPEQPKWTDATPPVRWQRTGIVLVAFIPPADIPAACAGVGDPPAGVRIIACTRPVEVDGREIAIVVMPDPCVVADLDRYAQVQCHENAHYLTGWRHETE